MPESSLYPPNPYASWIPHLQSPVFKLVDQNGLSAFTICQWLLRSCFQCSLSLTHTCLTALFPQKIMSSGLTDRKMLFKSLLSCLCLLPLLHASPLAALHQRQSFPNEFNPSPDSGLDDPTIQIADPSFATAIKAGYQGPMASGIDRKLVGPVDLLRNGHVNYGVNPNFTMPLYYGLSAGGAAYWWIVTDTSDEGNANQLGLNFSPKLRFSAQGETDSGLKGAEQLNIVNNTVFGRVGMVDFSPVRNVVPGDPMPFPPKSFQPGSVGDDNYTPLVQLMNAGAEVYNAPVNLTAPVLPRSTANLIQDYCR